MRITMITIGTRGDMQPILALGVGLREAGHEVRIATHATFEAEIKGRGVDFFPVEGNIRAIVGSGAGQDVLEAGDNPVAVSRRLMRAAEPIVRRTVEDMWRACQDADLIVLGGIGFYGGYDVAQKLAVPFMQATLQPVTPTRAFHSTVFPAPPAWLPWRGSYNLLSHRLFAQVFWQFVRRPLNRARRQVLNLPPAPWAGPFRALEKMRCPVLYGYSPSVLPKPVDWGEWLHVTGYWFLDRAPDWQPADDLASFIESGSPPVYVGFGSMNARDAARLTAIVLEALALVGRRGILLTGWGGLTQNNAPEDVYVLDSVPHDWLFPRTAAVVHHGGAGTTAAGLRAGVPSIVVPFFGDQFFWGHRVHQLGVGPRPVPRKRLTAERLAQAMRAALDESTMHERAAALGERIRAEDGVARAVEVLSRYLEAKRDREPRAHA